MEYLLWVIVALLAYSVVAPLTSIATRDIPAAVGLFFATNVFLVITTGVLVLTGTGEPATVISQDAVYIYVGGFFLTVGILAYASALEAGPVSVVVPIFGMFIVGSSVIGIVFLEETLSVTRGAGIVCAIVAIYFSAGDER
ncbi:EamA family transporter [Halostagnicola bangensis]